MLPQIARSRTALLRARLSNAARTAYPLPAKSFPSLSTYLGAAARFMLETVWEARAETLLRGSLAAPASCMRIVAGRLGRLEYNSERIRYEAPYDTG